MLFGVVEAVTQAIKGLCIPYDEQECLYFSVLNSVYCVSCAVEYKLEEYWVSGALLLEYNLCWITRNYLELGAPNQLSGQGLIASCLLQKAVSWHFNQSS